MLRAICTAATLAAIVLIGPAAHASLLTNGDFESGVGPGQFLPTDPGSANIDGWTVTRGQIDYIGTLWPAGSGSRSIDLNGSTGAGGVLQSFATLIGGIYEVTFSFAGNPQGNSKGADPIKDLQLDAVSGAITTTQTYSFNTTGKDATNLGWITGSLIFTASATTSSVELFTLEPAGSAWGPTIDNVAVNLVPEPTSMSLLILGGAVLLRRNRRQIQ